ncbi:LacI family DNA-binding transcriptional regulator [Deinococcus altitudinis]|uniref:LacI family DNA-binding transcriptional regulator n=1 Tax=Deinococcus altitudinis TaxID=468914 RepID=UPI003892252F
MTGSPTVRDVAKQAGVSVATVSRSLNNQPGISQLTRQRVLNAAHQLGYDLGNLRQSRLRRVMFLYRRQAQTVSGNPFYSHVLHGVEDACRTENLGLSFSTVSSGDPLPELIARQEAEGLVCAGYFEPEQLREIQGLGLPTVLVDHWFPGVSSVNSDNFGGAYLLTEYLITQGFGRIAFISGPQQHYSIAQRLQGYRHALLAHGRAPEAALEVSRSPLDDEEGTDSAVRQLLALPERPDAIVAYNDATALRALRTCQLLGLSVPNDMAVVGFDDLASASVSFPRLTSVRVNKEELGMRGVECLLHRSGEAVQLILPVSLVIRESALRLTGG